MYTPFSSEQLSARQQANVSAIDAVATLAFDSMQGLFTLNVNTSRALWQEAANVAQSFCRADGIQEFLTQQPVHQHDAIAKATAYADDVRGIFRDAQSGVTKVLGDHWSAAREDALTIIHQFSQSGLPAADKTAAAVKSFLGQTDQARDSLLSAMTQLNETAEAHVAGASKAIKDASDATVNKPQKKAA